MKSGLLATIQAIWQDEYPIAQPRKHQLIEKILLTPIIFSRIFSLANLRPSKADGHHRRLRVLPDLLQRQLQLPPPQMMAFSLHPTLRGSC
jgi:hypothetical protein